MNIELYIGNKLCDLEKSDLSIRLKRQFINPTQLSTKDSQKSYTISLPSTPTNDAIFKYGNVEEVQGKFTLYPDARLYVNGLLIMEGKFRLSEITRDSYKGNLGVPAPLTVKDVFGERKMNDAGEWKIDFKGEQDISAYNKKKDAECIFPLVLYGLMNKDVKKDKTVIDNSTQFALQNFPPSVNCVQMLKKIFANSTKNGQRYSLSGTALNDKRLQNLYVSYRNPSDYAMPFTYDAVEINGTWTNVINPNGSRVNTEGKILKKEHKHKYQEEGDCNFIACDILQSDNVRIKSTFDPTNLLLRNGDNITYKAPVTGLYKIKLDTTIEMPNLHFRTRYLVQDIENKGFSIMGKDGGPGFDNLKRDFRNVACEVKLVRHNSDENYPLKDSTMDNEYKRINKDPSAPEYYPNPGNVHFIDPKQTNDILCGFSWGGVNYRNEDREKDWGKRVIDYINPLVSANGQQNNWHNPIAMKHGKSWDQAIEREQKCATNSPGYAKLTTTTPNPLATKSLNKSQLKVELTDSKTSTYMENNNKGTGTIEQMIHLTEGEKITLLSVIDMSSHNDWIVHNIDFNIRIEPFKLEKKEGEENSWLKMHADGYSTGAMDWKDPAVFLTDKIDLIKFLPSTVKIDDWVNDFCKTFNLDLQHKGKLNFELNLSDTQLTTQTSKLIDLDQKASVQQLVNQPFNLPKTYELGFTVKSDEEGYYMEKKEEEKEDNQLGGAGIYDTGSVGTESTTQKSKFSYCWYKNLTDKTKEGKTIRVPVISNKEVWQDKNDYKSMESKKYLDLPQRFWYKTEKTHPFLVGQEGNKKRIEAALVSNSFNDETVNLTLDYQDKPSSIMRSYFMLLDNSKNYSTVECYLTPEEYNNLDKSLVKYNGDLYNVAEADGYDPMGRSKTKLKLIKKG